jgi:hypothetical protein
VVVGRSQQLSSLLTCGIRRHGIVYIFIFREKGRLGTSVDRTAAGKDKVLHTKLGKQFHQVRGALNITVNIDVGVRNGRTYTGTSGHVADPLGTLGFENTKHEVFIPNITVVDFETLLVRVSGTEELQVGILDAHIVSR